MKTSDTIQSSEESLAIITKMIRQTRGNVRSGGFYFILWGWIAVIGNVGQYLISTLSDYPHPYVIWIISIPGWLISMWYGRRQEKRARFVNYTDRLIMWTWCAFAISIILIIFSGRFGSLIPSIILILAGMATFITGCITRYKPLIYGGSSLWIFAAVALYVSPVNSLLVSAAAVVAAYLIPGYLMNAKKES